MAVDFDEALKDYELALEKGGWLFKFLKSYVPRGLMFTSLHLPILHNHILYF